MDCRQFLKEWNDTDGEQFTEEQVGHLESCGSCRSKVEKYRETIAFLKAKNVAVSIDRFTEKVMDRINNPAPIRHSHMKAYASVAAACALLLIAAGIFQYQKSEAKNAEIASMFTSVYSYKHSQSYENTYTELEMVDYILDEFD